MSNINRGKQFEQIIKESFLKIPDVSIDRLQDPMMGYAGVRNICDFIVYKEPYEYYIECKTVHGNTLPFSNITENQWNGLLEKSKIQGVFAGVICWWVDRDRTAFIPIRVLQNMKQAKAKSFPFSILDTRVADWEGIIEIRGKKKRVFFDYDMDYFFHGIEKWSRK